MKKAILILCLIVPLILIGQPNVFYDTSKIINGNGIATRVSLNGRNLGFETRRNYNLDGEFYFIDTSEKFSIRGNLKYQPFCVNNYPGVSGKYITEKGDTIPFAFDSTLFKDLFPNSSSMLLETKTDSVAQSTGGTHPELHIGFGDPAVIPIGRWSRYDIVKKYTFAQFDFDDCGNILIATYFNPDGTILIQHTKPPRLKRKREWQ